MAFLFASWALNWLKAGFRLVSNLATSLAYLPDSTAQTTASQQELIEVLMVTRLMSNLGPTVDVVGAQQKLMRASYVLLISSEMDASSRFLVTENLACMAVSVVYWCSH
jgi:hypothetical protein